MPAVVISASVVSGAISEIEPTVVVLPTPKPPATRIFTGIGGVARCVPVPAGVAAGGRYGGGAVAEWAGGGGAVARPIDGGVGAAPP
ncbi:hypothetical protein Van01_06780 [Micromonospora andamanensis]|uniref:Uncharacterized protein n=1 Tax=Micromonospora andamanensis TaxID=1287068 RepID=A0ABQ4HP95_9ACTN|nr:hypothetical protein Van01_06780 [Micromonospora andamanensis]GIJ36748.1 hypothetical protein Vwe01_00730 [Micromonospora andamanensis]